MGRVIAAVVIIVTKEAIRLQKYELDALSPMGPAEPRPGVRFAATVNRAGHFVKLGYAAPVVLCV